MDLWQQRLSSNVIDCRMSTSTIVKVADAGTSYVGPLNAGRNATLAAAHPPAARAVIDDFKRSYPECMAPNQTTARLAKKDARIDGPLQAPPRGGVQLRR